MAFGTQSVGLWNECNIIHVLIRVTQQIGKLEFDGLFDEWFSGRCGTPPCPPHL